MNRLFYLLLFMILPFAFRAQTVVINEVDADQPGADSTEFVELYGDPGMSLDGYVLVFYNGGDPANASYQAIDLSGSSIPASGYFVVGNVNVPNVNIVINDNTIQNGADAVVLYQNTTIDLWPNGTVPSIVNAVDAVVYGTADAEDVELMATFASGQVQLDEGAANNTNSLSRVPNGGAAFSLSLFVAQAPTPGASNGGGSVDISESENIYKVFPNPVQDILTIATNEEWEEVQILDVSGRVLVKERVVAALHTMNVQHLPAGMYILQIKNGDAIYSRSWAKQ